MWSFTSRPQTCFMLPCGFLCRTGRIKMWSDSDYRESCTRFYENDACFESSSPARLLTLTYSPFFVLICVSSSLRFSNGYWELPNLRPFFLSVSAFFLPVSHLVRGRINLEATCNYDRGYSCTYVNTLKNKICFYYKSSSIL